MSINIEIFVFSLFNEKLILFPSEISLMPKIWLQVINTGNNVNLSGKGILQKKPVAKILFFSFLILQIDI